ncbi:MAG: NAD(P)-binding domain-containing protein [Acidobacteriota bacterium]|jgi:predicted dinucleotide-binding enzyme
MPTPSATSGLLSIDPLAPSFLECRHLDGRVLIVGRDSEEAAAFGDVVVLAVRYVAVQEAIQATGSLKGKLLFSCVNALKPDYSGLAVGTTSSAAEEIAKLAPEAHVVEGLPAFAEVLQSASVEIAGQKSTVFVSGEDANAKKTFADHH